MNQEQPSIDQLCDQAVEYHKKGYLAQAECLYAEVLTVDPAHFMAAHSLGVIRFGQGRNNEALALIGAALKTQPSAVPALANYGIALQEGQRFAEALESFDKALAAIPNHPDLLYNRGNALWDLKRFENALASYDKALAVRPDFVEAWNNRGNALHDLGRFTEALASFDRAIALRPGQAEAWFHRGNTMSRIRRSEEALTDFNQAIVLKPDYVGALVNRGNILEGLKRFDEALASFNRALAIRPGHVNALNGRGNALFDLRRLDEALVSFEMVLTLQPDHVAALLNRGNILKELKRFDDALACFDRALALEPGSSYAFGSIASAALHLCDWKRAAEIARHIRSQVEQCTSIIAPLIALGYCDDSALQLRCAQTYILDKVPATPPPLWNGTHPRAGKIRIAYLSADFYHHATAVLMAGLFERHDRSHFEILAVSFGPVDDSSLRARLIKSFDGFHDVHSQSDRQVAELLHALSVDIAVDLKGYTANARPEILSYRPCPVQVSYLGYPGTMGADFIDYVLADAIVLPFDRQDFYTEKIVHLPDCYQVNDSKRPIAAHTPTRREAGLPDKGFIFCCFNTHWKITAPVFDIWMRLLAAVPGSLFWLIEEDGASAGNMRREAAARGIDPSRLIFAPKMEQGAHLARHRLADLALDTLPCNAHTTASDALWAGLPLISCPGESFAARVGASLLHAVGMSELVTRTPKDYESLALELARDPAKLRSLRRKLEDNRLTRPLFDTDSFRRHIEAAYMRMMEIAGRGGAPQSFAG